MSISLTLLHMLVAFTPLYFFITRTLMRIPEEVIAEGRIGLILMLPWCGSIAFRRFRQGILVRFGHTKRMSLGTILRLMTDVLVVFLLSSIKNLSGLVVATAAQGIAVFTEAAFIGLVVQPVIKNDLKSDNGKDTIRWRSFAKYYTPFIINSVIMVLYNPMNSAAMGRMPMALASLATWPVVSGFMHAVNNLGQACREVTLTYFRKRGAYPVIRKFSVLIGVICVLIVSVFAFTPLFDWYLRVIIDLPGHLIQYAKSTLYFLIPMGMIFSMINMYTGIISYNRKTVSLLISTIAQLTVVFIGFVLAVSYWHHAGIFAVAGVTLIAAVVQLIWLFVANREYLIGLKSGGSPRPIKARL